MTSHEQRGGFVMLFLQRFQSLLFEHDSPYALSFAQGLFVVTLLYPIVVATVNKDITEESERKSLLEQVQVLENFRKS